MKKGEIWLVELPSTNGREQKGKRPVIILSETEADIAIIIPFTSNLQALRFPNTIELAISAMIFAIIIGGLAGIISASKQYSITDYTVMGIALFGNSMPVFWLGIMLMLIFGVILGWLPIGGRIDLIIPFQRVTGFMVLDSIITGNLTALGSVLRHLILPSVALGTIPMAMIA